MYLTKTQKIACQSCCCCLQPHAESAAQRRTLTNHTVCNSECEYECDTSQPRASHWPLITRRKNVEMWKSIQQVSTTGTSTTALQAQSSTATPKSIMKSNEDHFNKQTPMHKQSKFVPMTEQHRFTTRYTHSEALAADRRVVERFARRSERNSVPAALAAIRSSGSTVPSTLRRGTASLRPPTCGSPSPVAHRRQCSASFATAAGSRDRRC